MSSNIMKPTIGPRTRKIIKNLVLISLFLIFIYFIILIKIINYDGINIIYVYTVGITTFMLSRVVGSFLYVSYKNKLTPEQKKQLKTYYPSVTFVIPSKNEASGIYQTIVNCLESNYPHEKIEIIAVNDGSTDNTLSEMNRAKNDYPHRDIKVINFKINQGKRIGMTTSFRKARGELIIQLDSDSFPEKNALKELINPFIDERIGATVGHADPSNKDKNLLTRMQTAYYFMSFRTLKATESLFDMVFCCSGCFAAYRKSYVLPILDKFLAEKFNGKPIVFGDDRALTNWMIKLGYKTVYVEEARAYTAVPEKLRQFLKQQTRWKKGWLINSIKVSPYVFKKDKFVAITYFLPLILLTLLTPFIAFKALIINPIFLGISPLYYILGIMLVSAMLCAQYHIYSKEKYGKYMFIWSILNMTILSYILLYAVYDLRNMAWGTR